MPGLRTSQRITYLPVRSFAGSCDEPSRPTIVTETVRFNGGGQGSVHVDSPGSVPVRSCSLIAIR